MSFWSDKRVFLTGHTGFKGGWLSLMLSENGADVHGFSLDPPTEPNFFDITRLPSHLASSTIGDIRNRSALSAAMRAARPDIVFHLAAQPLVRRSYADPVETYEVNVIGTVNVLEAVRQTSEVRAIVNITTDKCYENREWVWPYREPEALGGFDPYSSSKACSELITSAYRRSFFGPKEIRVASARAGNVIGGGDWAVDRLIPDFFRSIERDKRLTIRSPLATRPWQHVLEPLSGYLLLAEKLYTHGAEFSGAWNFGPDDEGAKTVQWIVEYLCRNVPGVTWHCEGLPQPHEAHTLRLDISKAKAELGWHPRLNLETALSMTLAWYEAWKKGADMAEVSLQQIRRYQAMPRKA